MLSQPGALWSMRVVHVGLTLAALPQVVQAKLKNPIKNCMIDKSKTEIAALAALHIKYLLCLFHMLQDWERFLRNSESGVKDVDERLAILSKLKELALVRDEALFKSKEDAFKDM